jgi:hypothetical protein
MDVDAKEQMTLLFDKVLDDDLESEETLTYLVKTHGIRKLLQVAKNIDYVRYFDIERKVFHNAVTSLYKMSRYDMAVVTIKGCRSPLSRGVGKWDGAYVFYQQSSASPIQQLYFYDEYCVKESTILTMTNIDELIEDGWIPMTSEDITLTSGLSVSSSHMLILPIKNRASRPRWRFILSATSAIVVLGFGGFLLKMSKHSSRRKEILTIDKQ